MKKKCPRCGKVRLFHRNRSRKDGLCIYCIECCKALRQKRRTHENKAAKKRNAQNRKQLNDAYWRKLLQYQNWKAKKNGKEPLDPVAVKSIFESQNRKCFYCKTELTADNLHIEHFYPKRNDKIVIACADCNRLKWQRDGNEFVKFLKEYISRFL